MRHKKDISTNYGVVANKHRKISIRNVKRKIKYSLGLTAAATITGIIGLNQSFSDISSALSISSLSSTSGSVDGGNEITIKGKGFLKTVDKQDKITQIAGDYKSGYSTVFALTESGRVYGTYRGYNRHNQASTNATCSKTYNDGLVRDFTACFNGKKILKLYNGAVITEDNIYLWVDQNDYPPRKVESLSGKHIIGFDAETDSAFSKSSIYSLTKGDKYHEYNLTRFLDGSSIEDVQAPYVLSSNGSIIRVTDDSQDIVDVRDITDEIGGPSKQIAVLDGNGLASLSRDGNLYLSESGIEDTETDEQPLNISSNVTSIAKLSYENLVFTKDDNSLYSYDTSYDNITSLNVDSITNHTQDAYDGYVIAYTTSHSSSSICTIDSYNPELRAASIDSNNCISVPLETYTVNVPSIQSIRFGDAISDKFTVIDDNTIKATVPPHTIGRVDVTMTDNDNKQVTLKGSYEYIDSTTENSPSPKPMLRPGNEPVDSTTITAPNTGV